MSNTHRCLPYEVLLALEQEFRILFHSPEQGTPRGQQGLSVYCARTKQHLVDLFSRERYFLLEELRTALEALRRRI